MPNKKEERRNKVFGSGRRKEEIQVTFIIFSSVYTSFLF